jgi:transcription elongation factor Elf1
MSRAYRAPNRRVIQRAGSGQFRQTTLADVGVAQCRACGEYFTPDVADLAAPINPRDYRDRQERCAECRENGGQP